MAEMPSSLSFMRLLAVALVTLRVVVAANVFERVTGGLAEGWIISRTPKDGASVPVSPNIAYGFAVV